MHMSPMLHILQSNFAIIHTMIATQGIKICWNNIGWAILNVILNYGTQATKLLQVECWLYSQQTGVIGLALESPT